MRSYYLGVIAAFLLMQMHGTALAEEWEGRDVTNFVTAEISGWQLQCNLRLRSYEDPSKCFALYNLADGNVVLDYRAEGLRIQTMGSCGMGVNPSAPLALPVTDLAKAIEAAARRPGQTCKPPVLTAELFAGIRELNTTATILTQKHP